MNLTTNPDLNSTEIDLERKKTFDKVLEIIVNAVNLHHLDRSQVDFSTPLTKDGLGLDSVDILEVVVTIEQHFKVKVGGAEAGRKHFATLGTLVDFVLA